MRKHLIIVVIVLVYIGNLYAIDPKPGESDDEEQKLSPVEKKVMALLENVEDELDNDEIVDRIEKIGEQAVPILLRELYNKDIRIVVITAYTLNKIYGEKAIPHIVNAYAKQILRDDIYELTDLIQEYKDKALQYLQKELNHKDDNVRCKLVSEISHFEFEDSKDVLRDHYKLETSNIIKLLIIKLIYTTDIENQKEYLKFAQELTKFQNLELKCDAIEILGIAKDITQLGNLIKWSEDEELNIRTAAISSLCLIGSEKAIDAVINDLKHKCKTTRFMAADKLSTVNSENEIIEQKIISALIEALGDDFDLVRLTAIISLSTFKDMRIITHLHKIVKNDPDEWNQEQAKDAIEKIGMKNGIKVTWNDIHPKKD